MFLFLLLLLTQPMFVPQHVPCFWVLFNMFLATFVLIWQLFLLSMFMCYLISPQCLGVPGIS